MRPKATRTRDSTVGFDGTEIIISPLAKGNAYTNNILYTHSSDLVTLQNIFGVAGGGAGGYLGGAGRRELARRSVQGRRDPLGHPRAVDLGDDGAWRRGTGRRRRLSPEARRCG